MSTTTTDTGATPSDPFRRSLASGPPLAILDAVHALAGEVATFARPLAAGPPIGLLRAARAIRLAAESRRASEAAAGASEA